MKKISVIVAAYNAEKYIDKCIQSVLSQNADTELIVINDASTDKTAECLEKYKGRIKLISLEKNTGSIAGVRNIGLENAGGEYITYLDADDWYEKGALSKIINYLDRYKPDILKFCYLLVYPGGGRKIPNGEAGGLRFVAKAEFDRYVYPHFIGGINLNSVCCAVFKRSITDNIRFSENYRTAEDAAFALEAYTKAQSVLFVPDRLYCYYQSGNGLTGGGLSVLQKYKYNFMLTKKMLRLLPEWEMNTLPVKIKALTRPVRLTFDKLKRM